MRNRRNYTRGVIRSLKRRYGDRVLFNRPIETVDRNTGKKNFSTLDFEIRKVIVLPERAEREFVQRLASIVANREFTYGTYFDASVRRFIIDGDDSKRIGYEPEDKDFLVWNYRRYEVTRIDRTHNQGFMVTAKEVKGNKVLMTIRRNPWNRLVMGDSVSQEVT